MCHRIRCHCCLAEHNIYSNRIKENASIVYSEIKTWGTISGDSRNQPTFYEICAFFSVVIRITMSTLRI